jgi:all-trans-retinol 13,14-reductase
MERIGRRYRAGRAAEHYDTIVIGSGIGGLTNAALLARLGRKVCVLEQHYTAGGFTHSYERNGYEWDVGVHYIGDVRKPEHQMRRVFDVISDGRIQWAPMDAVYDRIVVAGRSYDFVEGRDNFAAELKKHFPGEARAIDAYVELVYKVARSAGSFFAGQAMPPLLARAYNAARGALVPRECLLTVREVLESLTQNQELIGVLTGQWGDYGMVPAEASFLMHATVAKHYFNGGNYPKGGSWKIAESILPVIRAGGGEVFTYARVKEILVENERACGVRMDNGDALRADNVVSSVGARLTYEQLLPEAQRRKLGYAEKLKTVKPSGSSLCLFLGFKGSAKDLKLPKTNLWIYPSPHHEQNAQAFLKNPEGEFPLLYISFPSAKDPEWDRHYPGKSTVQVITMAPYEWFEKWRGSTWNQRGGDYDAFKEQLAKRMLAALWKQMPQLEGALDFYELATPLSTEWFHLYDRGEIYGLDHDPQRFKQNWLHPVSKLKGLYLTGQDVVSAGVGGALMGGVVTTSAMLGLQAWKLQRLLKSWQPASARADAALLAN